VSTRCLTCAALMTTEQPDNAGRFPRLPGFSLISPIVADCRTEVHVTEMQPAIIPNVGLGRLRPPTIVLRKMVAGAVVTRRQECCGHHRLRIAQAITPPGNMSQTNDPGSASERKVAVNCGRFCCVIPVPCCNPSLQQPKLSVHVGVNQCGLNDNNPVCSSASRMRPI